MNPVTVRRALLFATIAAFVAALVWLDGWAWVGNSLHVLAHVKVFAGLAHALGWLGKAGKVALIAVVAASVAVGSWWRRRVSPGMSSESPGHPPTVSGPPTAG